MSGSASSGTCCKDQMPPRVSSRTLVNTRKRFRAQASMILESMSYPYFGVDAQLLCADGLAVLLRRYRDLPRSAGLKHTRSLLGPCALLRKQRGHTHRPHAHRWHGSHKERDCDLRPGNGLSVRSAQLDAEDVGPFMRRVRIGGEINRDRGLIFR